MKKLILAVPILALVRAFAACSNGSVDVSSISPDRAPARGGDVVTIHGSGFEAGATVRFAGQEATVRSVTGDAIEVTAPFQGQVAEAIRLNA